MFDRSLIGQTSEPRTFEITAAAVAQFIEATGDPVLANPNRDPLYVPLTFPTTFRVGVPGMRLDGSKMQLVHGEQEYSYVRNLRVGETVTCVARILDMNEKNGRSGAMTIISSAVEGRDSAGELVFTGRSSTIVRPMKTE